MAITLEQHKAQLRVMEKASRRQREVAFFARRKILQVRKHLPHSLGVFWCWWFDTTAAIRDSLLRPPLQDRYRLLSLLLIHPTQIHGHARRSFKLPRRLGSTMKHLCLPIHEEGEFFSHSRRGGNGARQAK